MLMLDSRVPHYPMLAGAPAVAASSSAEAPVIADASCSITNGGSVGEESSDDAISVSSSGSSAGSEKPPVRGVCVYVCGCASVCGA